MDTKQVTDQHRSEGHALSNKALEGVANEVIKAHWGEQHVAFGVSSLCCVQLSLLAAFGDADFELGVFVFLHPSSLLTLLCFERLI